MSVTAYSTIVAGSAAELDAAVATAIGGGKQPIGEARVFADRNGNPIRFVQTMIAGSQNLAAADTSTITTNITALQAATPPANVGKATLIAGTKTVATAKATATAVILLTVQALGTVATVQVLTLTRSAGVSFTITSADATDTSVVGWQIIEPAA